MCAESAKLLDRDTFRCMVFRRDNEQCVSCRDAAVDAHHLIERRLFRDGGYYLDNGVSLCGKCHILAEQTLIGPHSLRSLAGIQTIVLPEHLYPDASYDKWGNEILPDGQRLQGELFDDESVQKILRAGGVLHLFTDRVRYPRTWHLPWSGSINASDRVLHDWQAIGEEIVVTPKWDGGNFTLQRSGCYARSPSATSDPSQSWVRNFHARIAFDIPERMRICGENLYATVSISYQNLSSYFLAFNVWEGMTCLSWDDTQFWCAALDIPCVEPLYRGPMLAAEQLFSLYQPELRGDPCEGYVVRTTAAFHAREFSRRVGKYVRPNHNQVHGRRRYPLQQNGLLSSPDA